MDNKRRKLFVTKQSKGCKFLPKMHQSTFGGRPDPPKVLMRFPDPLAVMESYFSGEGGRGGALLLRSTDGREGRKEGT